jgi:hypothetical protein
MSLVQITIVICSITSGIEANQLCTNFYMAVKVSDVWYITKVPKN